MDSSQKKVVFLIIAVVVAGLLIGFGVYRFQNRGQDSARQDIVDISDPSFDDKEKKQEIEDFAEGIEATEYENNSFTFDSGNGKTSISTGVPKDYPDDVPNLKAEVISAARSDSGDARKMFTVFWESDESYNDLEHFIDEIISNGWEKVNEDIFEASEYIRFEKSGRRLDFSLANSEEDTREVMIMVEE